MKQKKNIQSFFVPKKSSDFSGQEKTLSIKDCYIILTNYRTPNMVVNHTESVAKVAYLIGKKMKDNGEKIDLNLLVNSALLHDIFKIIEVQDYYQYQTKSEVDKKKKFWDKLKLKFKGTNHENAFIIEFGKCFPKISNIVIKHKYSEINNGFEIKEAEILYYSDKLVKFDKITTLKKRLDEAKKRYAHKHKSKKDYDFVNETDKKIFTLQKQIFKTTGLSPKELIKLNDITFKKLMQNNKMK